MPLLALHRRFVLGNDKMATAPDLSLRGRSAPVAISGRHSQPVQAAVKMEKAEIWGVAALTAQPLAALPPYGCGVPFTGSERLAGWQCLRHKFIGAMPSGLSLRGRFAPVAISGRQLHFRRQLPHDPAGYCEIATSACGLLAMTNLKASRRRMRAAKIARMQGARSPYRGRRIRKAAKPPTAAQ